MRVLVTRPKEDAERVVELLRARNHGPIVSPLMEIRFLGGSEIALDGVQAILATSANGVRALARRTARRELPVFAVGPQTASAARAAGFSAVKDAQGDALALANAVREWARPGAGVLVHATGRERTGDLAWRLSELGYDVRTDILYEAVPADSLSQQAYKALSSGMLDAVMLFSPHSARIFRQSAARAHLEEACRNVIGCFISPAAALAVAPLIFRELRIADRPNLDAMISLLDQPGSAGRSMPA
jgi:uroporphyrinogen-III synthase